VKPHVTERVVMIEPMGFGGICHYTYNLCEALAARNVRVSLITARNYEMAVRPHRFHLHPILNEWFDPGIPEEVPLPARRPSALGVGWRRLKSASLMLQIMAIVLRSRAAVVHLQWPLGPHDDVYLAVLRAFGRHVVYTAHDVLPHEPTPDAFPRLHRLLKHVDRVILHSAENERDFHRTFADDAPPSTIVPHGNYAFFVQHSRTTPAEARAALGIPPEARVVLFFGMIRPYKGLNDLVNAFGQIRNAVSDAWLLIAGYPQEPFAPYDRALGAVGIRDCTTLRLGYHEVDEVAKFFRAADVVVLPYRSASQSGIAQLAFAFAKPVIATRVGGLPEVIEEGRSGLLVDPGDDRAIAQAAITLLTNPSLRHSMGLRSSELAASRFSWDRIAEMTLSVYDRAREPARREAPLPE
jgi:D-inositol-3-phosphate glycosyltransferase